MRSIARIVLGLYAVALMTILADAVGTPPDSTADVVYGQLGSFETATLNKGGISGKPTAETLWVPGGVVLDRDGNLYVADTSNNRVLFFPAGERVATRVYGQIGSFTTNVANFGSGPGRPTTADGLSAPEGVALDSQGNLYVADRGGNRVLFYPADSTTATRSYGQGGSLTSTFINNGHPTFVPAADSLWAPFGVALDGADPHRDRTRQPADRRGAHWQHRGSRALVRAPCSADLQVCPARRTAGLKAYATCHGRLPVTDDLRH